MEKIRSIKGIDHIGYAVKDMAEAKEKFKALGFDFSPEMIDELRDVNVCVGQGMDLMRIELLSPIGEKKSPVDTYLRKLGSTPYHICYQCEGIEETIGELCRIGFTQLSNAAPSVPLNGNVCFLFSAEIGLIELIEYGE